MIKLIAFDLDGTLTQHKTPLEKEPREVLLKLREKYKLVMAGAGQCQRIFNQMEKFPIDIIGNYGLQFARYNGEGIDIERDLSFDVDRESVEKRVNFLREKHGFVEFAGDSVEYHPSGCVTFAILGTRAAAEDKLAFDPDRKKRRAFYSEVCSLFPEYNVFVGGSSSFDMAPRPYNKYYALSEYCKEIGIEPNEVLFVGDDYGLGGNDESVYLSDMNFLCVDNYKDFPKLIEEYLK